MNELTPYTESIYDLIMKIPPDFSEIRRRLEEVSYSSESISRIAVQFAEACFDETVEHGYGEKCEEHYGCFFSRPPVLVEGEHSTYLVRVMELLLEFGLDPNAIVDNENVMQTIHFIENEYVAADTYALLFEHGADNNLVVDNWSVFKDIDFDVLFDAYNQYDRRYYDSLVHCWFVWLGYGARLDNGETGLELFEDLRAGAEFDVSKLRNHRDYTFGLSHVPSHGENWSLHIFDKRTMWEVARL